MVAVSVIGPNSGLSVLNVEGCRCSIVAIVVGLGNSHVTISEMSIRWIGGVCVVVAGSMNVDYSPQMLHKMLKWTFHDRHSSPAQKKLIKVNWFEAENLVNTYAIFRLSANTVQMDRFGVEPFGWRELARVSL